MKFVAKFSATCISIHSSKIHVQVSDPFLLNANGLYENTPMQYTAIFHGCKNSHFQMIFFKYFLMFAQTLIVGTR